jgi:Dolichyl-phosphate-mannose-protein mannosyltransferase
MFNPAAACTEQVQIPLRSNISGGRGNLRRWIAAFAAFWCATVLMLSLSGAFTHELGGAADEAAHFMTGLMIHDYVVSGIRTAPLDFAKNYYAHYPKLAFGIWPPLFHVMEAAWMVLISPSKASVLLMLSGITALLAFLLFRTVERRYGFAAGICAGLLLISTPIMQQSTSLVMVDSSVALFSFLAIIRFGRFLDSARWQDSAMFGVWASAAILSKYNGVALAFVPPLCAAFTGQWHLMRRGSTWLAAGVVLVICGSWYLPMWRLVAYAAEPVPRFATVLPAMQANTAALAGIMGIPLLIVAGAGMVLTLRRGRTIPTRNQGIWFPAAALIVSCWAFHSITTQDPEPRYLLPALAPLILFLAAGIHGLSRRFRLPAALLAFGLSVVYAAGSFTLMRTPHLGYAEVASDISKQRDPGLGIILADGAAESEGMAVSEIAIRERRPAHYVLRGSKMLARSTWMGANYHPLYQTPERVLQALDAAGVSAVILQTDAPADIPHHRMLADALHSATGTWTRWADRAWAHSEGNLMVYRRIRPIEGPFCVEVSLEETLHRNMRICIPGPAN